MESLFSFPVGLFHPLQHAGLSRRTPSGRRRCRHHRRLFCRAEQAAVKRWSALPRALPRV
jgi:hypothetical protein